MKKVLFLVLFIMSLFLITHAHTFVPHIYVNNGLKEVTTLMGLGKFDDATSKLESLQKVCNTEQCTYVDFARGHLLFWESVSKIGSSQNFFENIYSLSGGVHPVQELAWIDDQQPEIQSQREQSVVHFGYVGDQMFLSDQAIHNQQTIEQMLGSNQEESQQNNQSQDNENKTDEEENDDTESSNEDQEKGEDQQENNDNTDQGNKPHNNGEKQPQPLSDSVKQQLEDYSEQMEKDQERYQQFFNKPGQGNPGQDPFEMLENLFGDQFKQEADSNEKDW